MRSDIRPVVFVAPFFAETTLRFVAAAASQPDARVGLISQDPAGLIPAELRRNLAAHVQIGDGLDAKHLIAGIRKIAAEIGPPERLLGALEQLQVPLAEAREALGIPGSSVDVAKNFRDKSRMKDVLRAANVPCARHRVATSPKEALRLAEELGYPLVAKPPDGAGAVATHRVDGSHDLTEYVELMPPTASHPLLLEEFIVGEERPTRSDFTVSPISPINGLTAGLACSCIFQPCHDSCRTAQRGSRVEWSSTRVQGTGIPS